MNKHPKIKTLMISHTFSTPPFYNGLLDDLLKTGRFVNLSDIMRQALSHMHQKQFPYQKQRDDKKEEETAEQQKFMKMPADSYAAFVLNADLTFKKGFAHLQHRQLEAREANIPLNRLYKIPEQESFTHRAKSRKRGVNIFRYGS